MFSLFHFCAVTVSCPEGKLEQWAFVFYTTYVKQKGFALQLIMIVIRLTFLSADSFECKVEGNPEYTTNTSEVTQPENIFYLELVQVILCLALISTTLLLPKISKDVTTG